MERRGQKRRTCRPGLAAVELVLWLPILLLLMALMVNFGTAAVWRLRAEVVARDAVWGTRFPRGSQPRPEVSYWPPSAGWSTAGDEPISLLDDPLLDQPVVRGPLPNGIEVRQLLDPDRRGARKGRSHIHRRLPFLPTNARLGQFDSGRVQHRLLDRMWPCTEQGLCNWSRRSRALYAWPNPTDSSLQPAYDLAAAAIRQYVNANFEALRVMDQDQDVQRYRGHYVDLHPRPRHRCLIDPVAVHEQSVERYLVDYRDRRDKVRLGGITQLPSQLTRFFLSMYRRRVSQLEQLIEELQQQVPQTPDIAQQIAAAQAEITMLEPKIQQLEAYEQRLPEINDDLLANSPLNDDS